MQREILDLLKMKDETGVTPKWIGLAIEILLRAELARLARDPIRNDRPAG